MLALYISGENTALFMYMNAGLVHLGDSFWSHTTILGDSVIVIMFILPFVYRRPEWVWQFVLTAIIAGIVVYLLKDPEVLRPPAILEPGSFHLIGPALRHVSFPSGHTTTAFLVAGLFCMQQIPQWLKTLVLMLALAAGLSRIACGIHWPMDVLGGMVCGWLAAGAGIWLGKRWKVGLNIWFQRFIAILFTIVAIWSSLKYDNGYPGTVQMQLIITFVCLALSVPGQLKLFSKSAGYSHASKHKA
ncbi:MAG: phosphatase PAP2 family protein [Gallionella sp.]